MDFNFDSISKTKDIINFQIWKIKSLVSIEKRAEKFISKLSGNKYVRITPSARYGIYLICSFLKQKNQKSNLIVSGFTCSVVASSALASGVSVKYCDVNADDLLLNKKLLISLVDENTSAIIVQHIFGRTDDIDYIKRYFPNILVIEDCAHSFGGKYNFEEKYTGFKGHVAIFSFDHTKPLTALGGGALATNIDEIKCYFNNEIDVLKRTHLIKEMWLLFIFLISFSLNTEPATFLKKILFGISVRIFRIKRTISNGELMGKFDEKSQSRLNFIRLAILLKQFSRLFEVRAARVRCFNFYNNFFFQYKPSISWALRYAIDSRNLKHNQVNSRFFNRWFSSPLHPVPFNNLHYFGYQLGMCPVAEELSKFIINLPTGPRVLFTHIKKDLN